MTVDVAFGSDNHSCVHPKIFQALNSCNSGYATAYGEDEYTQHVCNLFKKEFGTNSESYLMFTGTAANILGLKAVTQSFQLIFCADTAHLHVHECGGPEHYLGCKILAIPTINGKLTVDIVKNAIFGVDDPHIAQPRVISITQPSEYGTLYTTKEINDLAMFAHEHNMVLHMDGARLANAAAALRTGFKELTGDVGVDVLSFGGTKNGMLCGEAVVFFKPENTKYFHFIRKQGMQLASKMRYLAVQFQAYFTDELWRQNALQANTMAALLAQELKKIKEVRITQKVQTNAVFVQIPPEIIKKLRQYYFFHVFDEKQSIARFMCSYTMTKQDINNFINTLHQVL